MRPSPYRWIPIILIALVLLGWLSMDLLPRFVGGLLGRGDRDLGAWGQTGRDLPEIVWDTHDPRLEEEAPVPDETPPLAPPEDPLSAPELSEESPSEPLLSTEPAEGNGLRSASPEAAGTSPGEGPGEGRRRAARLLYQEWPRESMLRELDQGGNFRFRLRVEADGRVSSWEILESFDCEVCASEAERIVRSLQFRPSLEDGHPVACWVPFEIRFFAAGEN